MKDEFVSTVSHELRTPLTSIRGALGLLSAGLLGEVSEKAANLLRIAVSNSDRLVRLINDILDLERMQSGRAPLSLRRCALSELAQQAIDAIHPVADAASVTLSLQAEAVYVDADSDRILQVMTNLLSNAVKFSPANSQVQLIILSETDGVTLSVIDEGRGVPADKLETIFDRFQQVDASDSRQKGGTGLGLAICRTIAQQHGGRIWAERNPERGTTFRMFLPVRINHEAAETAGLLLTEGATSATVMICDEDDESRRSVVERLQRNGYHVIEAENGQQATALARQFPLNAILLAVSAPGLDGWETLRALKGESSTAGIPIVVLGMPLSGIPPREAQGANGWIPQPLDEELVLRELARVLRGAGEEASVLLVEDDEDMAGVVEATFERAGIRCYHAATRRRAIELCQSARPDLVILDLALPDGDGFHIVDWLRQHEELRKLPLVVYSAREVSDEERQQLRLGPTEFLTKATVPPQDVEALVQTMLQRYREGIPAPKNEAFPGPS
jgi:CheY-like chemotaxis protein/two-component sensor histidine kinase